MLGETRRWQRVVIMARRPQISASEQQRAALQELARSERRDEADRARAILLSLQGWTSQAIVAAFAVTADSVRHWRNWYTTGGVAALRAAVIPGPSGERGLRAGVFPPSQNGGGACFGAKGGFPRAPPGPQLDGPAGPRGGGAHRLAA